MSRSCLSDVFVRAIGLIGSLNHQGFPVRSLSRKSDEWFLRQRNCGAKVLAKVRKIIGGKTDRSKYASISRKIARECKMNHSQENEG